MADQASSTNRYEPAGDRLQFAITLLFIAVLLVACIGIPVWLASSFHPGWGSLAALASSVAWMYLGPPPMPGFFNGIVSVLGIFGIIGVFLGCAGRAIYLWVA